MQTSRRPVLTAAATLVVCALASACDASAVDPSYWDRELGSVQNAGTSSSGATGTDGGTTQPGPGGDTPDAGGETPVPASTCFSLSLTTVSYRGEYGPDHVGAIWISRPDGTFVRTLEAWGRKRLVNAVAWRAASRGNVVDAITGATRQAHGTHAVSWNCRDTAAAVEPGAYVAHVEYTEDDSAEGAAPGPHRQFAFDTTVPGPIAAANDATVQDIVGTVP